MRVLIVEDDKVLSDGLTRHLHQSGYVVEVAGSGVEANAVLATEEFDLVVLDIGLPGMDGFEILRRVRRRPGYLPVLVLTARDALEDRVHGLDLGADDYLVKPFALQELEARIRAVLRRGQAAGGTKLAYGSLVMDTDAKRAWLADSQLRLTAREWLVLEFLVTRAGKIVNKDQIVSAISNRDDDVSHNALEVHISRLRSKLEPAGLKIHSIRGFGYYLDKQAGG
jgi:two-component system OmpR family response regulator